MPHGGWTPTDTVVAPTCSAEGYTINMCKNDPFCTATKNMTFVRRVEHDFTEYVDGRLVCKVCDVTYRDITTYKDEAISSGDLKIDDTTTLQWELKGYENPKEPNAFGGDVVYTYEVTEDNLKITNGLLRLSSTENATYTIVVECGENSFTFNVEDASAWLDLYVNEGEEVNGISGAITKVTITATAAATVVLYAYEG